MSHDVLITVSFMLAWAGAFLTGYSFGWRAAARRCVALADVAVDNARKLADLMARVKPRGDE